MADFTALKTAIQNAIKQNGNEEITGDILQGILLSIVTTLGDSAINDLITALTTEVNARQQADGTLQQNITDEANTRGNADTALSGRIDDEATARGNADTALSNRLGSTITAENTAAEQIAAEATARESADTALGNLISGITSNIENGYVYAGIATPSSTPAAGKVFYLALTAGTYTNFGSTVVSQGINILKYNGTAWSLDTFIGIDSRATSGSDNLVNSKGVKGSVNAVDVNSSLNGINFRNMQCAEYGVIVWSDGSFIQHHTEKDYSVIALAVTEGEQIEYKGLAGPASIALIAAYSNGTFMQGNSLQGNGTLVDGTYTVPAGIDLIIFGCTLTPSTLDSCVIPPRPMKDYVDGKITNIIDSYIVPRFSDLIYKIFPSKYINGQGNIGPASSEYTTWLFKLTRAENVIIYNDGVNSYPFLTKFASEDLNGGTILIANKNAYDNPIKLTLDAGYYAVTSSLGSMMCTVALEKEYYTIQNINNKQYNFRGLETGDFSVDGSSVNNRENGINLIAGQQNRCYINGAIQSWHFRLSFTIRYLSGTPSFTFGKQNSYGTLVTISGSSMVIRINNADAYTLNLGFSLAANVDYNVVFEYDVIEYKRVKIEIYSQYDDYFTYTTPDPAGVGAKMPHSIGNPVLYSNVSNALVKRINLSVMNFYDLANVGLSVVGHSYVEADTLGADRDKSFVGLLANELGEKRVINFGLGGDVTPAIANKIRYYSVLGSNAKYCMLCTGANDFSYTAQQIEDALVDCIKVLENYNIIPILFTIQPVNDSINSVFRTVNAWIRNSGYLYVDMEQVFLNTQATSSEVTAANIKTELYLADHIHPTIQGHQYIYQRIKMDCPFLF